MESFSFFGPFCNSSGGGMGKEVHSSRFGLILQRAMAKKITVSKLGFRSLCFLFQNYAILGLEADPRDTLQLRLLDFLFSWREGTRYFCKNPSCKWSSIQSFSLLGLMQNLLKTKGSCDCMEFYLLSILLTCCLHLEILGYLLM